MHKKDNGTQGQPELKKPFHLKVKHSLIYLLSTSYMSDTISSCRILQQWKTLPSWSSSSEVCSFPRAAIIDDHKQHRFSLSHFRRLEIQNEGVSRAMFIQVQGRILPLLFQLLVAPGVPARGRITPVSTSVFTWPFLFVSKSPLLFLIKVPIIGYLKSSMISSWDS